MVGQTTRAIIHCEYCWTSYVDDGNTACQRCRQRMAGEQERKRRTGEILDYIDQAIEYLDTLADADYCDRTERAEPNRAMQVRDALIRARKLVQP